MVGGCTFCRCPLPFLDGARKDGRAAPFAVVSCRFSTGRGRGDGRAAPFAVVSCRKRKGEGGGWRRRTLAPSRNGCVLGARAAGPHPDGWNRGNRCQRWCCGAGLAALTFPPSPLPLPRCGRGRGDGSPSPSPLVPCRSSTGRWELLTFALARFFSSTGRGRGNGGSERILATSHATVACWERGPLARILMEGCTGVSAGAAEHAWRPSPSPQPPSSPALRARKGEMGASHLPPSPPAAPPRGDGSSSPLSSPASSPPQGEEGGTAGVKEYWQPPTPWLRAGSAGRWPAS